MSRVMHPFFSLIGDFDPDEITRRLEIQPSWVKRIGGPGPSGALGPRLGAEWAWQPLDDRSDDAGDQLAFMAGALSLSFKEVAEFSQKYYGTFHAYNEVDGRGWALSPPTLRLIADLHVSIKCENVLTSGLEISNAD